MEKTLLDLGRLDPAHLHALRRLVMAERDAVVATGGRLRGADVGKGILRGRANRSGSWWLWLWLWLWLGLGLWLRLGLVVAVVVSIVVSIVAIVVVSHVVVAPTVVESLAMPSTVIVSSDPVARVRSPQVPVEDAEAGPLGLLVCQRGLGRQAGEERKSGQGQRCAHAHCAVHV